MNPALTRVTRTGTVSVLIFRQEPSASCVIFRTRIVSPTAGSAADL